MARKKQESSMAAKTIILANLLSNSGKVKINLKSILTATPLWYYEDFSRQNPFKKRQNSLKVTTKFPALQQWHLHASASASYHHKHSPMPVKSNRKSTWISHTKDGSKELFTKMHCVL